MNIVVSTEAVVQDVQVTDDEIIAKLADGRVISVPLAWSWRLSEATPAQRANWRLIGAGTLGTKLGFSVPWGQVFVLVGGTFAASLIATAAPAQQASRIRPAVALRIAD